MAGQESWDPLKDLVQVQERMNRMFESALARTDFDTVAGFDGWTPTADVTERPDRLLLCLELPGFKQDEINLRVDGDALVVEGERRMDAEGNRGQFHRVERAYGKFSRRFPLPSRYDRERIEANYRNGLLDIALPARDSAGPESYRIDIR